MRAVEQLRLVVGELKMAAVRAQVMLSLHSDFADGRPNPAQRHEQALDETLDQVVAWSGALAVADDASGPPHGRRVGSL